MRKVRNCGFDSQLHFLNILKSLTNNTLNNEFKPIINPAYTSNITDNRVALERKESPLLSEAIQRYLDWLEDPEGENKSKENCKEAKRFLDIYTEVLGELKNDNNQPLFRDVNAIHFEQVNDDVAKKMQKILSKIKAL